MKIVTMKNWITGAMDTFDLDTVSEDDVTQYIPIDKNPVTQAVVMAIYNICRDKVQTPRQALTDTLMSIAMGEYRHVE